MSGKPSVRKTKLPVLLILCFLTIGAGVTGFFGLKQFKKPPQQVIEHEHQLSVETIVVHPKNIQVQLVGFGEVRSTKVVTVSAEVAGRVTMIDDNLEVGHRFNRGQLLLTINDRDFHLELETAEVRLKSLGRNLIIANKEFRRVNDLYVTKKVGSQSNVEKAESEVNAINNQLVQVRLNRDFARLRIDRCRLISPFDSRVGDVSVEEGEYVSIGRKLFTLVNDSQLELHVSLDASQARQWLKFLASDELERHWFGPLQAVSCNVLWTESNQVVANGILDRVVRFAEETRTLVVAVRLAPSQKSSFPISVGMFCRVEIPGQTITGAFPFCRKLTSMAESCSICHRRPELLKNISCSTYQVVEHSGPSSTKELTA